MAVLYSSVIKEDNLFLGFFGEICRIYMDLNSNKYTYTGGKNVWGDKGHPTYELSI